MISFGKYRRASLIALLAAVLASPLCRAQGRTFSNIFQLNTSDSYLGISMEDVTSANMSTYKLTAERGAIVRSVAQGSPAESANIKENDVILEYGGYPVWSDAQLSRLVQETPAGRKVEIVVSRDGKRQTLSAVIGRREGRRAENRMEEMPGNSFGQIWRLPTPNSPGGNRMEPAQQKPRLGVTLQPVTDQLGEFLGVPDKKGALVASVLSGSPSAGKLKSGDVIIRANGKEIDDPDDLVQFVRDEPGGNVTLKVIRDKKEITVVIDLPSNEDQKGYKL